MAKTTKGGKTDETKEKWENLGYLDGLSEEDKKKLASMMESAETDFEKNPTYSKPITVVTTGGSISFDISDVIYKGMREAFDQKQDPDGTTFDHALIWNELTAECVAMAEKFYGSNESGLFDSVNHYAFAAKFGYKHAAANLKGKGSGRG